MSQEDIVIVGMARTPMGGLLGELANLSAPELGAVAVKAAVKEAGVAGAVFGWGFLAKRRATIDRWRRRLFGKRADAGKQEDA